MYFATRVYAFYDHGAKNMDETFTEMNKIPEITHVDLNYPEHFDGLTVQDMADLLKKHNLICNGLSTRFRKEFLRGDFGNANDKIAADALKLALDGVDVCAELNAPYMTIYVENDGFDYCFQVDYARSFEAIVKYTRKVCEYAKTKGVKVSFEYKPYEPRKFMMIDSFGMAMHLLDRTKMDNIGLTLDYCHMLMKKENPATGLAIALEENRIDAIHMNDGWGRNDDGMMVASASPVNTLEFVYYLKRYGFDGMIFFDTFPILEDPVEECKANVKMFKKIWNKIDEIGLDKFDELLKKNNAIPVVNFLADNILFN